MPVTQLALGLAVALALLVGWRAMPTGRALGVLDWPDPAGGRKQHAAVTPLVGGIAVVGAVLAALALMALADPRWRGLTALHMGWFAAAAAAMLVTGMADDRFALGAQPRLAFGLVVFTLVTIYAPDFRIAFLRFQDWPRLIVLGAWATPFTIASLVGLMNAVNMADGKNGLVIGLALVWTLLIWLAAPPALSPVCAALLGALAVTFAFNMRGRLFLGDAGSYGISAIIGLLAVYVYNHAFDTWGAEHVMLLFIVPVLDTLRLITARALRGGSPFAADRDHLHHHIAYRFGWPRGLAVYLALVAVPNAAALAAPALTLPIVALSAAAYVAVLVLTTWHTSFNPGYRRAAADVARGLPRG